MYTREDRDRIWLQKARLKNQEEVNGKKVIWLKQDVPKEIRDRMIRVIPVIREAIKSGKYKNVGCHYGSVILDGTFYKHDKLSSLPSHLQLKTLAKRENEGAYAFFSRESPLSNHYMAKTRIEGICFDSMEQFIAYKRARYAGDFERSRDILKILDPVSCRVYLNEMKQKEDQERWINTVPETLIPALKAKARQHPEVKETLRSTGNKRIGEAAKFDFVWGIGMALDHENVLKYQKWPRDGNLLGKAWEEARKTVIKDKN